MTAANGGGQAAECASSQPSTYDTTIGSDHPVQLPASSTGQARLWCRVSS